MVLKKNVWEQGIIYDLGGIRKLQMRQAVSYGKTGRI